MRGKDRIISLAFCGASVLLVLVVIPRATVPGSSLGLPSAFVPTAAATVLGLLSAVLALSRGNRPREPEEEHFGRWKAVGLSVAAMVAALGAMLWIGYVAGAVLLVAAFMLQLGVRSPLQLLILPFTTALLCWGLARFVLKLPLP